MYTAAVLNHFKNPRNAGELADATATVKVSNPVCGDILQLSAHVDAGRFVAARFKAQGCVTSVACGSHLTEMLVGKTLAEARSITCEQLAQELGGLPAATVHGAQLACDALRELLARLASEMGR